MINKDKNNMPVKLSSKHLLGIENLNSDEMLNLIERSDHFANLITKDSNQINTNNFSSILSGKTIINLFFESSTRTRVSFEVACKKLGGSVLNISVSGSSVKKGETLIDTATTLNAMNPDILVIRHHAAGAPLLLSKFIDASVINAGDGRHEHPTQALLDALTIKRRFGKISGLNISICGDIANSRVARSNMYLLGSLGANLCLVSPSTLLPSKIENFGFPIFNDLEEGIHNADIVMMLRLQKERFQGKEIPSQHEYYNLFGLDNKKLKKSAPNALIMHPGPMNRGVEIDSITADDDERSLITTQVEMGVATRMACLEAIIQNRVL